jgi:hypothetical protein
MTFPDDQEEAGAGGPGTEAAGGRESIADVPDFELADLRTLLGPWYRHESPRRGGRYYSDPLSIAGRPRSRYLHVIVLGLAAAADFATFLNVILLVLGTEPYDLVVVVVLGFTVTALYLAHTCGILFRDCAAGAAGVSRIILCVCFAIWLSLGGVAFFIRLGALSSSGLTFIGGGATGPSGSTLAFQPATLFLALYLATGLAAGIGAYFWRNPLLDSYARAKRGYLQAHQQADTSFSRADSAEVRLSILRVELTAAERTLDREISSRLALAEMLKQVTPTTMASGPRDGSATRVPPPGDQSAGNGGRE